MLMHLPPLSFMPQDGKKEERRGWPARYPRSGVQPPAAGARAQGFRPVSDIALAIQNGLIYECRRDHPGIYRPGIHVLKNLKLHLDRPSNAERQNTSDIPLRS